MKTFMQVLVVLLWATLLLMAGLGETNAQTTLGKGNQTTVTGLFESGKPTKDLSQFVGKADYLQLDKAVLQQLLAEPPANWSLEIPTEASTIILDLEPNQVLSSDFVVRTSDQFKTPVSKRAFYKGKVRGHKNTLVTISLFEDMVMGFISIGNKDYVLGHLYQDVFPAGSAYILYEKSALRVSDQFACGTADKPLEGIGPPTEAQMQRAPQNVVEIYIEADYGLFQNKGSVQNTTNYLTGLFNQTVALYAVERVNLQLSEIFVWNTPDGYPSNSSGDALAAFRDSTGTSFNGDIALLAALDPGGLGGVAYLDVLCNTYYAKAYADINSSYSSIPTYSWSVMVVTHELGHNLGSRHTHACAWGPNENEAIDGCGPAAGYDEGCSAPLPSNGGTMMSYCHLVGGVGINFNHGFGPNPGDKIRYEVSNAACLSTNIDKSNLDKNGADALNVNQTTLTVTHNVINNGIETSDAAKVGYFLTPNTTLSTFDIFLGYNQLDTLDPNESTGTLTFTVDIDTMSSVEPGTYFVGYYLDYEYETVESNENDNSYRFVGPSITKTADNFVCLDAFEIINNGNYITGNIDLGNGCENCSGGAQHARWYKFTPATSGLIDITSCFGGANSRLWVYTGSCGNLTQVGSSDDYCAATSGGQALAAGIEAFAVNANTTYYFEWDNRWTNTGFDFDFSFYAGGDQCNVAVQISNSGNYPKSVAADGPSSGAGCYNCNNATNADWFSWTAPSDGLIDIASCDGGADTRVWIYEGSCNSLTQVGSSDDNCQIGPGLPGYASQVLDIPVTAGSTYYIEWDDRWSTNGFNFSFDFTSSAPPVPNCTALSDPLSGQTNVSIDNDLTWLPATGNPTGYKLYAGYSANGNEILNGLDVGNVTTYDPGTFPYNTTIFVKIVPYNATGDAIGCAAESFTTQAALPSCTALSNPLDGATNVPITSALTWNAAQGNPTGYRLTVGYTAGGGEILNNVDVGNVNTYQTSAFNYNATIFVKIIPYNGTGLAIGCTEESFSTQGPAPGCSALTQPLNGTTNVAVDTDLSWTTASPTPLGYKLTVGYTSNGGEILNNLDVGNVTTYNPGNFLQDTQVFVKIIPYNATGDAVGCQEESFFTAAPLPTCSNLVSPSNGAANVSVNTTIQWAAVSGANGYKITAGYTSAGTDLANNLDVGNVTSFSPGTLAYDTTVFLTVIPYNNTGDALNCSEESFSTQPPFPNCTLLSQPLHGANNVDPDVDFIWNTAAHADGYLISYGTDTSATNLANNLDVGNATTFNPGTLPANTTIYVTITPYNGTGNAANCSIESFHTLPPPPICTSLQSPSNGTSDVTVNPVLAWSSSPTATGYKLTVGYTPQGGEVINALDVGNVTQYQAGPLNYNSTVYVTVVAYNNGGDASACTTTSFTTQDSPPTCTNLANPLNAATDVPVNTSLTWNAGPPQTTGYKLTVGYTANGGEILNNVDVGNVTTYNPATLLYDTLVYVKIIPYSSGGDATGCQHETFRTEIALPTCTQLSSPQNGATNVNIHTLLQWNSAANAAGYRITAGFTAGGTELANNLDLGNVTLWSPGTLPYDTTVFVNLTPYNAGGDATGCQEESFTTQVSAPGCTALTQPTNGQQGVPVSTDISWTPVSGATGYKITVGHTQGGGEITYNTNVGNTTTFDPGTLPFDTAVYVLIVPFNATGDATGCQESVFYTQPDVPACTQLSNPTHGSTQVDINTLLTWQAASAATGYKITAGYSSGSTELANNLDVGNVLSFNPGTLPYDTTVFVTLRPYNGTGETTACQEISFQTQVPVPNCTVLSAPLNGSTNVDVDADINWQTISGADGYKITAGYTTGGNDILNNMDVGNVTTLDLGTLLFDTTIFVKIIPFNTTGDANGCQEESYTTQPPIPACTQLSSPVNGAGNVDTNTDLVWPSAPDADGYKLNVGTIAGGTDILNNLDVGNVTTYNPGTLPYDSDIFVKLVPYNVTGESGNCTETSFYTLPQSTTCTQLISPLNGATNIPVNSVITWAAAPFATAYKITLGYTPGGGELMDNVDIGNVTSYNPGSLNYGATVYVKVVPYNAAGDAQGCQEESFITQPPLPACTNLTTPSNGQMDVAVDTDISWATVSGATGYKITAGFTSGGTDLANTLDVGNVTTFDPGTLPYDTTVFVSVIPYNQTGEAQNCVEESFSIQPPVPVCTNLTQPLNGAANVDVNIDFTWSPVAYADGYLLSYGTNAAADNLGSDINVGNVTSYDPGTLPANTTIFVKIVPFNATGNAPNCTIESFQTLPPLPNCSTLQFPQNGDTDVTINPVLAWSSVGLADGYKLKVGYTPGGGEVLNNIDVGDVTLYQVGPLNYNTLVYVTITPYNAAGDAQGCAPATFTTQVAAPDCTNLVHPLNGTTDVSINTSLSWNAGPTQTTGYKLTVGYTVNGGEVLNNLDVGNVTTYNPPTLLYDTLVYVKIVPYSNGGDAAGCQNEVFSTAIPLPVCTQLSSPPNGSTDVPVNSILQWSSVANVEGYKITAGFTAGGTALANNLDVGNATSWNPGTLPYDTTVFVTITPYNAAGDAQGCQEESFITQPPLPACTNLTTPSNGQMDVAVDTDISWAPIAGASGYKITAGFSSDRTALADNIDLGNLTTFDPGTLPYDTTVFVSVIPYNQTGEAQNCVEESFSTQPPVPVCTNLTQPLNGAANVDVNIDFTWSPVAYADGYLLSYGTNPAADNLGSDINVGNVTSYDPGTLPANTTIFVKIVPFNASGNAPNCTIESFQTLPPLPNCSTLQFPQNGDTDVTINPVLAWSSVALADGYKLKVGYTPGGGEVLNNIDVGDVTLYQVGPLSYNTLVYISITPYNAAGDAQGCAPATFTTQEAAPDCTNLVHPLNGTTDVSINTSLSWNAGPPQTTGYKLTVGYTPNGGEVLNNLDVGNVTTYNPPTLLYDTLVYVKIVPYSNGGDATGCQNEVFSTAIPLPVCTQLSSPPNSSTDVPVNSILQWSSVANVEGYKITAGFTAGGTALANNLDVGNATSWNPGTLPYDTTVFVTVTPYNAAGDAQGCQEESFTTQPPVPTCTNLTTPSNGQMDVAVDTDISWAAVSGATGYKISAGFSSGGTDLANTLDVGNVTTFDPGTLPYDTTVFVSIIPYNQTGEAQNCAEESFSTQPPAPVCTNLTQPLNGAANVDVNIDFTWSPVAFADGYLLSYGTNAAADNLSSNINVGNVTSYNPGTLPANTTIFVKIVPFNATGNAPNCTIESFQTLPPLPNCSTLQFPQNGDTDVTINPVLAWSSVALADGYKLKVGYTPGGGEVLNNIDVGDVTLYQVGPLSYNTLVYISITPYNAAGDAAGCVTATFTTQVAAPDCTNLVHPLNGTTDVSINTSLSWNAGPPQTTGYKLTVGYTPNGGEVLNNLDVGNVTTYNLPSLLYDTLVYVKIVPYSNGGDATGCQNEVFSTAIPLPVCTQLSSPPNGSTDVPVNSILQWSSVANVEGYKITAGFTAGGTALANNLDVGNATSWNPGTLPYDTTVFVTVTPYNAAGDAQGCQETSFTTKQAVLDCTRLTNPVNGSTQVNVNANFMWAPSPLADGYRLNAGYSPGGTEIANNLDLGNSLFYNQGTMLYDTTVFVTVIPYNASGDAIGCQKESFRTQLRLPECTFLTAPQGDAYNVDVNADVNWQAVANASGYRLTVGYSITTGDLVNNLDVGNVTTYDPGMYAYDTAIYVKIVPYNSNGAAIGCQYQSFTTVPSLPSCTRVNNPANGATGVDINSDLHWSAANFADGYKINIGTVSGGTDIIHNLNIGTATSYDPGPLPFDSDIFVTVKPYNVAGENPNCMETVFHTQPEGTYCTQLTEPQNGAVNVDPNTNLSWNAVPSASGYRLKVGYTPGGGEVIDNVDIGNVTSYHPGSLFNSAKVYVKVVPYNLAGEAQNCVEESFTIQSQQPGCSNLLVPTNGASDINTNTAITWTNADNASGYKLTVGYTPGGGEVLNGTDIGTDTSFTPGTLAYDTTVYVKIMPYNTTGENTGCQEFSFSTEAQQPHACTHPMAGNNTIGNISATIRWQPVQNANKYQIRYQVSGTGYWFASSTFDTEKTLDWLYYNTTYEYQLASLCPDGWTDWSPIDTFTTLHVPECSLPIITGSSVTDTSFTISWSGLPTVDEQIFSYRLKGTSTWTDINLAADTSYTANGLLAGNEYQTRLRAKCSGTWTAWSSIYSVITTAGNGPCESPQALQPDVFNTYANLSWVAVNDGEIYQVRYRPAGSSNWSLRTVSDITTTTLTWLYFNTTYEYQLRTFCPDGWTVWSQSYTFTTLNNPACTLPPYTGEMVTDSSFTITWSAAPGIDKAIVMYRRRGDSQWTYDTLATDTIYTAHNLLAGNLYQFRFKVHCQSGWTGWADLLNITTDNGENLCEAPDTTFTTVQNTSATIAWNAVDGENMYQIQYRIQGTNDWVRRGINNATLVKLSWLFYATTYEYELRALCDNGWTDWSQTYTFTTLDDPACSLPPFNGQSVTDSSFTVSWATAPGIDEAIVMYRRSGDSQWTYDTLATDTVYTAYHLSAGNLYYFRFRVHCPNGWTGWSDLLKINTDSGGGFCEAPDTTFTTVQNTSATIAWSAVDGENMYQIQYRIQGTTDWVRRGINNATLVKLSWLFYATTYEYELRALCDNGWTDWSQTYTFTTLDDPACSLPPFNGQSVTDSSFTVSWATAPGIDEAIVMYRRSGDSQWTFDTLGTDTVFTANNLSAGNLYYFRFRVHCPNGWTGWSDLLKINTDNGEGLCEAPDTTYTSIQNTSATIAWNAVNGENMYQIQYRIQGTNEWMVRSINNTTLVKLSWLFYATTYEYELRALCDNGWTNWSQTYTFTTVDDAACTLPPFTGEIVTDNSFTAQWQTAPSIDQQIVMYRRAGDFFWLRDTIGTDTFYTVNNLLPGNNYQFRFRVHCPQGWSVWSEVKNFVTGVATGNCGVPDTLYTAIGNTSATIAWTAENGATRYQLRYKLLDDINWTTRSFINITDYTLHWLFYDENYEYQLRAECSGGWTNWSNSYYFTTLPEQACTIPWVEGHTTTSTSFTVTWNPVYQVEEYNFRYRESGTSSWQEAIFSSGSNYLADNLLSGTTYQYQMRSKCSNGWSDWTTLTNVTTDISRPGPGKKLLVQQVRPANISMELYPNPARDYMQIEWQGEEGIMLFLTNLSGRLIRRITWNGDSRMEINVQSLQEGIYFMTAINPDGTKLTKKFLKVLN